MKTWITLELPPEFIALCRQDDVQPEAVLRGFIADLCIDNSLEPRTDGYGNSGSEARLTALAYYVCVGYPSWRKG
jgi:hypothetical protein